MAALKFLNLLIFLLASSIGYAKRNIPSDTNPSPFDFIKKFEGLQKGNNTKGIHEVKNYLKRFGYLEETLASNDEFDHALESAIKTYQENFDLMPTGVIDAETISSMMAPRCGVPDIINGTNLMHLSRGTGQSSRIHTTSHFSFIPGKPRWPYFKTHLTYTFLDNVPEVARLPIAKAVEMWANVSRFIFIEDNHKWKFIDIVIGFYSRDHGDRRPFDGRNGVLAHGFAPTDGRLHFDLDELWFYLFKTNDAYDIETVAAHEIGHVLGLGHSKDKEAIMYPKILPGMIKLLNNDDIAGIRLLYQ